MISVAAHSSELRIPNGTVIDGSLASFSSEGPTVDERIKPDISAPGVGVASSISSYTTQSITPFATTDFNGRTYEFSKFSGTSMSSPATTGVVALMLEANHELTAVQIKGILKNTAREDSKTGIIPVLGSAEWGWGKVNALAAVAEASRLLPVIETPIFKNVNVYPTLVKNTLYIEGKQQVIYSYKIFGMNGMIMQTGKTQNEISISNLPSGTYILHLNSTEGYGSKKIVKM